MRAVLEGQPDLPVAGKDAPALLVVADHVGEQRPQPEVVAAQGHAVAGVPHWDALEGAAAVGGGRQVQQGAERAVYERGRLLEVRSSPRQKRTWAGHTGRPRHGSRLGGN
jgi:hypothetical protein